MTSTILRSAAHPGQGVAAVSASVESAINALGVKTLLRFAGVNRYDTATQLANFDLAPAAGPGLNYNGPPFLPLPGRSPARWSWSRGSTSPTPSATGNTNSTSACAPPSVRTSLQQKKNGSDSPLTAGVPVAVDLVWATLPAGLLSGEGTAQLERY